MTKSTINNIKKMLNDYNEYRDRIKELTAQNKRLNEMYNELNDMETSDNISRAKDAISAEIELNNTYILEYTSIMNDYETAIENTYDDSRDYKKELRQDAMNSFRTMIENATSDYANGYSYEVFDRQNKRANEWLTKRMSYLDGILDNPTAYATMINLGIGSLR